MGFLTPAWFPISSQRIGGEPVGELAPPFVDVAELVDALGLGSSRAICGGSSPLIDIDTR